MKKLLLFLASLAIMAGCQQTPNNLCQMTGTVLNPDSTVFMASINRDRDTIEVNADGTFVFETESEKPLNVMLIYGRNRANVYLAPGKTLDFMVDMADWNNTQSFSGDLKAENNYILEKGIISSEWQKGQRDNYMKDPADYRSLREDLQQQYLDLLDKYRDEGIGSDFADVEKLSLDFSFYNDLANFQRAHLYYTKKDTVIMPEGWDSFKAGIDLNNPALLDVPVALSYIANYIQEKAVSDAGLSGDLWGTPELLIAKAEVIDALIEVPDMKEQFMFDMLNQQLDAGSPAGIEKVINSYLENSPNEENKTTIREKADAWAPILPGQPAPPFSLPDINGENLALSDLAGKYVYIDFWATWCGPCRAEFPHYRKLVEDYKGRNVVFMSISVDKDKEAWKKMVEEEAFDWVQLHDSVMMNDDYLVRYIPTFVFIDTDGKIIDPRAPRPSDPSLREMMDSQPNL